MSWFKTRDEDQIDVKCPKCGKLDSVSKSVSSLFCKNPSCGSTIYPSKDIAKEEDLNIKLSKEQVNKTKDQEKKVMNNEAKSEQVTLKSKPEKTKQTFSSQSAQNTMLTNASAQMSSGMKKITCSNCHTVQDVPSIALASFCEKCGQRINLQDYKIKGSFHGELETRGKICIAEGAEVKAHLNVGHAIIDGKIDGQIVAERRVELNEGCFVHGAINSPVLVVNEGAGFVGKAVINPPKDL